MLAKVIIFMARLASLARKRGTMILIWNSNNYELFNACMYEAGGGEGEGRYSRDVSNLSCRASDEDIYVSNAFLKSELI